MKKKKKKEEGESTTEIGEVNKPSRIIGRYAGIRKARVNGTVGLGDAGYSTMILGTWASHWI